MNIKGNPTSLSIVFGFTEKKDLTAQVLFFFA